MSTDTKPKARLASSASLSDSKRPTKKRQVSKDFVFCTFTPAKLTFLAVPFLEEKIGDLFANIESLAPQNVAQIRKICDVVQFLYGQIQTHVAKPEQEQMLKVMFESLVKQLKSNHRALCSPVLTHVWFFL